MPQLKSSHPFLIIAAIVLGQLFLSVNSASAQGQIELRMSEVDKNFCPDLQKFVVTVVDEKKAKLDRQAVVKLHDIKRNIDTWDTTSLSDSQITFCSTDFGDYEIEASAVGYLAEHLNWNIGGSIGLVKDRQLQLVMHKDPT